MTAKAVSALERGERRRPYPSTVRALCDALELDEVDRSTLMNSVPRPAVGPAARGNASRFSSSMRAATTLVGREEELAQLLVLLASGAMRLVTVTGPGGVGKTRLASAIIASWPDAGVPPAVVELAPVRTADLVLPTIALSFGLQVGTTDPADSIVALVGDTAQLLVLDNVEHVLETAPAIADLIARCPGLVVLATSRAPLRIRAEQEFPLGPLSLPRRGSGVDTIDESSAARMFAERARAVSPTFVVDASNAGAIASICARLDGLPLALELAATHIRYLSPQQLLDRLDHAITTPSWRDGPERHQTLTSTLDWSYELLTEAERRLLSAVSVFAGGFELDALAYVSGNDPLIALNGLVEQSLVLTAMGDGRDGERRFRVLEPVRSYASSLTSDDDSRTLAGRHAEFYVDLGIRARFGLQGPDQQRWLDQLSREHANLRVSLDTLLANRAFGRAAELGGSTWLYWALRGHAGEGIIWSERVLEGALAGGNDAGEVAMAHLALAGLRLATGDIAAVAEPAAASAAEGRLGDRRLHAEALVLATMAATFTGDRAAALARLGELSQLTIVLEDGWIGSHTLIARAQLLMMDGEIIACRAVLDDAEQLARRAAGPFTIATVLNVQATLANLTGDDDLALDRASLAARTAADAELIWTLVYTLPMLASQAASRGHHELAVALFAASEVTAESSLLTVAFRPDQDVAAEQLEAMRIELSEVDFQRAWEWGRTLSINDIVDLIPSISGPRERG